MAKQNQVKKINDWYCDICMEIATTISFERELRINAIKTLDVRICEKCLREALKKFA